MADSTGHSEFSLKGIFIGVAFCFLTHIFMIPTGLEGFAHEIGDGISEFFNGASGAEVTDASLDVGGEHGVDAHEGHDHHGHDHH